jgi:rSAM/selenodomain-associated transferase 1
MARRGAGVKRDFSRRLVIMAKTPNRGVVKRRLAREIGSGAATRFYRNCLLHTVLRLAPDPRWRTVIAFDGGKEGASCLAPVLGEIELVPQHRGDLGTRMQCLFDRLPPGPILIVGSDIPSIRPAHIAEAFRLLARADAVLGPAPDGGYWLVGLKRTPRALAPFAGVRWSGPHAFADTLANLKGRRVALAAKLSDVDAAEDLRRERGQAERLV